MAVYLDVAPDLLRWAVERAGWDEQTALQRFPQLDDWTAGVRQPTLKQLEKFAHATHAPFGQLFLPEPPIEPLPMPDLRTIKDAAVRRPSADLLDTIYLCQERQDWYRDFATENGLDPVSYIGSVSIEDAPAKVAHRMHELLGDAHPGPVVPGSWSATFRRLVDGIEASGALVMVSGVVGANTHRMLDPREFRGFALADEIAPLVYVNGADTKAAQIFTLIHEFAHLWLGGSALSDANVAERSVNTTERWCNDVAAEFLVPLDLLRAVYRGDASPEALDELARQFSVSTLVMLRRIADAGFLAWVDFRARYIDEERRVLAKLAEVREAGGGGNYYNTQPLRLSRQFARSVIESTHEGNTRYRDAYQLLGLTKHSTFEGLADQLGAR
ncbi:ImmA/IrrE family metallo-endopeptidase [Brachybacterium sp. 107]|uniref:ImmA/IrrE family metallo-endopeptidase n=1 Tax=Brachybacterium sp. 107 TaxID=3457736 RepID=UPI0040348B0E